MNDDSLRNVLAIAVHAAFADGSQGERERARVREVAEALDRDADGGGAIAAATGEVLLGRLPLEQAAEALTDDAQRRLAYEMAVCVCDADGLVNEAERVFLDRLAGLLGLEAAAAREIDAQAETVVHAADDVPAVAGAGASGGAVAAGSLTNPAGNPAAGSAGGVSDAPSEEEASMIKRAAILAGALELLPQSWASLAIIPLQIRLVYRIGSLHGYSLDQGHIKEFLVAAGIGMGSQTLEQFGRKLIGGLLGGVLGRTAGRAGRTATGMAFSFASTWAIGELARRHYAGGRQMDAATLRQTFDTLVGSAQGLQQQYLPEIRSTAGGLDAARVAEMVRRL
jgi:uncharacterized membrane protein YebE (DUF533 family)